MTSSILASPFDPVGDGSYQQYLLEVLNAESGPEIPERRYEDVRGQIRSGDVLFKRPGLLPRGRLVAQAAGGDYCHVAMAAWWGGALMCLEMHFSGGRAVTLSSRVRHAPGLWVVYEANPHDLPWERHKAVETMVRLCGEPYGWWNLLRAALRHAPGSRWLLKPSTDDLAIPASAPTCSQAISMAVKAGGLDPVQGLADEDTEPVHLSRSPLFRPRFVLR